jgi:hypothetical protein
MTRMLLALLLFSCGPKPDPCTPEAKTAIVARAVKRIATECHKTGPCPPKDEAKAELAALCP